MARSAERPVRREGAEQQVRAVQSDVSDLGRQLRALVARAYIDLKLAQDKRSAAWDNQRLLDVVLSAAQIRKNAGDIAGAIRLAAAAAAVASVAPHNCGIAVCCGGFHVGGVARGCAHTGRIAALVGRRRDPRGCGSATSN